MIVQAKSAIVGTSATGRCGASNIGCAISATRLGSDGIADAQH